MCNYETCDRCWGSKTHGLWEHTRFAIKVTWMREALTYRAVLTFQWELKQSAYLHCLFLLEWIWSSPSLTCDTLRQSKYFIHMVSFSEVIELNNFVTETSSKDTESGGVLLGVCLLNCRWVGDEVMHCIVIRGYLGHVLILSGLLVTSFFVQANVSTAVLKRPYPLIQLCLTQSSCCFISISMPSKSVMLETTSARHQCPDRNSMVSYTEWNDCVKLDSY